MTLGDTIIPRTTGATSGRDTGWLDRQARAIVERRLRTMAGGGVFLIDRFGESSAERWVDFDAGATRPARAEMIVHDPRLYRRLVLGGSLAAAEGYIQGQWSSPDLTTLLRHFVRGIAHTRHTQPGTGSRWIPLARLWHGLRRNTLGGSRRNIHAHYDLGNEFFGLFLDPTMSYSCAIFDGPNMTLEQASVAKLDRVCRKLEMKSSDHLLEIGTGWGGLAIHAARRFGCRVTTTTISDAQHTFATGRIAEAGLQHRIDVKRADYRQLTGQFDKLVSIEMVEAVGHRYLDGYFEKCASLLKPDGMMLLQGITMNEQRYEQYRRSVDFIQRYVFPGSCCPSLGAMVRSIGRSTDLRVFDVEDIGPHYATTLRRWREAFFANIDDVCALGYPPAFLRLWDYYLSYCEAGFAERYIGDVQMLLTKPQCRRPPLGSSSVGTEGDA